MARTVARQSLPITSGQPVGASPDDPLGPRGGQARGAVMAGVFRYLLWHRWNEELPRLLWVMLNPSTADGNTDDPTMRKCRTFSAAWGYGGFEAVNLFALRTPYPRALKSAADPVGSENDRFIAAAAGRASAIVVAWGNHGTFQRRDRAVLDLLARDGVRALLCLGMTRQHSPRHPLYLAGGTSPVRFPPPSD
ncbi:MAG TPA: DUF1643 domain-containing protein [Ktedonobacterales bacterium]|nr:DUF1643 domain-containing protein [Ktedonobacterales bacterium]